MANNKRPQAPSAEPWEQMTGETVQQYEKFCAYRDMFDYRDADEDVDTYDEDEDEY